MVTQSSNSHKTKSHKKKSVSDFHNSCNVKERRDLRIKKT